MLRPYLSATNVSIEAKLTSEILRFAQDDSHFLFEMKLRRTLLRPYLSGRAGG